MANHPHNSDRPDRKKVLRAIATNNMELLGRSLSVRQRTFCEEYIVDYNGKEAAIRAGYAPTFAVKQASALLRQEGVAAYLAHLNRSKEAKIFSISPDWVIQKTVGVVDKENVRDGDKLRALELLARHLGMFIDRTEISGPDGNPIEHKQISEDVQEFADLIQAMRRNQENMKKTDVEIV